jgi:DNA-directed RNA polymerase subunit beta
MLPKPSSIIGDTPRNSIFPDDVPAPPKPQPLVEEEEPKMRAFGDARATREAIYSRVHQAATELEPSVGHQHTLQLADVEWADPDNFSKKQRKEAILGGRSMGRRLRGTWRLTNNETGDVVDERKQVVARVPYVTDSGTFVNNGSEYAIKNQQRLRAGIFVREKDNGELEAHANVLSGGPSHRYFLDPSKGVFYMSLGQAKIPLMPLMRAMGATDAQLRTAWGPEIHAANYGANDASALKKLHARLLNGEGGRDELVAKFEGMELDPEVTKRTLGVPFDRLNLDALMATTSKLIAVGKKEAEVDDRDHLAYQTFLGPEDLIAERLRKDRGGLRRSLMWKASLKGHLQNMPSSALQDQIDAALLESGLGQALEEINPAEIFDKQTQISRMGEGGIPSLQAVPEEARGVQPSHMGFMDPLRTPESFRVGVDVHLARNARKGENGKMYSQFRDVKSGKDVWRTPQDVADMTITFPGELRRGDDWVPAMRNGRITWVPKKEVDLELPQFENAFSPLGNMVPLKSMVKGQRVAMASRMLTQALPLMTPESPLVQSGMPGMRGEKSFEDEYGAKLGAIHAEQGGRVVDVNDDEITVQYDDNTRSKVELYNNHPHNRKTYMHQTSTVNPGQRFEAGSLLARSNFTDDAGTAALGINADVAYVPWGGKNFEDAIVISEGMAKRLTSDHMYQHDLTVSDRTRTGKSSYISLFPGKYDKAKMETLDDEGIVLPGTVVNYGDPLILAAEERSRARNKIHKKRQPGFSDQTVTWKHHDSGVVTDVAMTKKGPVVLVKSQQEMRVGDKLSGRYGDKGVISSIIPDNQMPHNKDGTPYEVLLNPLGVISRTNPAQMIEAALGKLAKHTGRAVKVEDFRDDIEDMTEWAIEELRKAGISDTEDITDPATDTKIRKVTTGNRFFMKLHHTAEGKGQGRGSGGYTAEGTPAKGGETGSKRVALLDVNALLSHGATEVLRDANAVRGQKNEEYWLQFMQGNTPRAPKVPEVYNKFVADLKASGINVVRDGAQVNIMAMTDDDIDQLAGDRNVSSGQTVRFGDDLKPIGGGLFDKRMTGGHHGNRWSAIKLAEPMPNPVMEEPIRRVLGLTQKKLQEVIAGREDLPGYGSGPSALAKALDKVDLDRSILLARAAIKNGTKGDKDAAVRRLGYLKSAKDRGLHPRQWMLKRAPVLPPQFRPVSVMGENSVPLVADPNFLYKELIEANSNLQEMRGSVGDDVGDERLAVYNAFKAVTGLGDPITQESKDKNVRGILKNVFGSSPKFGTMQRKLLGSTVDNVGRAVITPDPSLDMDSVGLPEDRAFEVYQRFIVRRLKRKGMPITQALRHAKDKTELARQMLLEEMEERPVIINRAPVLHRFGIMAFKPRLVKGSTLQVSPLIVGGFGADFDGDAMNYHVPTDEEARKEALAKMLPSRQLLSPADFKTPVHQPGQEYVGGLYQATTARSKRPVRTFRNQSDAVKAYRRGEIAVDDRIEIMD